MFVYILFLAMGIAVSFLSVVNHEASAILQNQTVIAVTATAIIANLIVPFAAFANNEKWQKLTIQYGPVGMLGFYIGLLIQIGSVIGAVALALSTVVHLAYWTSSIHSRQYRFELFAQTLAARMPAITQTVAVLKVLGNSHLADQIISHLLQGEKPTLLALRGLVPKEVLREAENEVDKYPIAMELVG